MTNDLTNDELYNYMVKFDIFHVDNWYDDLINPSDFPTFSEFLKMIYNDKKSISDCPSKVTNSNESKK